MLLYLSMYGDTPDLMSYRIAAACISLHWRSTHTYARCAKQSKQPCTFCANHQCMWCNWILQEWSKYSLQWPARCSHRDPAKWIVCELTDNVINQSVMCHDASRVIKRKSTQLLLVSHRCVQLSLSQASIQSLYTSTASDRSAQDIIKAHTCTRCPIRTRTTTHVRVYRDARSRTQTRRTHSWWASGSPPDKRCTV